MIDLLERVQQHPAYLVVLAYFAWYPIFSSALWIASSLIFYFRREWKDPVPTTVIDVTPPVTVLIAAYNEEEHIEETLKGALAIDYPDFEVVVVNDGSTDRTRDRILPFVREGKVRLVDKRVNEGKAMALNDALPCTRGEIVLIIDADAVPDPQILRVLVPHFLSPRVAAVTGNPRVVNRESLLSKLQAIEFSSIISLQRRAQRVWGRILTMSGVVGAFHRQALLDAGGFSPDMATEDIDLTWKLQLRAWDIRYEPRAVVWMRVPQSLRGLWRQRRRWAIGLAQVLGRHGRTALAWRARRLWPVLAESVASILWAYCFVGLTALWILSYGVGYPPVGASPIPNWWGMLIGTLCLAQLLTGVLLDRRYDDRLPLYYIVAVFYPLIYWILMATITALYTPAGLRRRGPGRPIRWRPVRE
jgi:biofilm PGA synthesis N-glycosyltransferase PgaC